MTLDGSNGNLYVYDRSGKNRMLFNADNGYLHLKDASAKTRLELYGSGNIVGAHAAVNSGEARAGVNKHSHTVTVK